MVTEHLANANLRVVVCKMLVFRVCGVRQNHYVFSLYRNPDVDDQIFHCSLASMAAVQAEDFSGSFLFIIIVIIIIKKGRQCKAERE